MSSLPSVTISIQTAEHSLPATPPWLGEIILLVHQLRRHGVLDVICERVRFARRRFGRYEVIDFLAALFGYEILGERTLEANYLAAAALGKRVHGALRARPLACAFDTESLLSSFDP